MAQSKRRKAAGIDSDSIAEEVLFPLFFKQRKDGINYQIPIGHHHIDFFIENKIFIEYHPPYYRKKQTNEEYQKKRENIIKTSSYAKYPIECIFENLQTNIQGVINRIKNIKEKHNLNLTSYFQEVVINPKKLKNRIKQITIKQNKIANRCIN